MHGKIAAVILFGSFLGVMVSGCSSAKRAMVQEQDMAKVFPWPNGKDKITIHVKPETLWVNTCTMLGSFEEVEVTPETTFYIVDKLDKKFAYTPSRSPIRRLAQVQSMEIRWPLAGSVEKQKTEPENQKASEKGKGESDTKDAAGSKGKQGPEKKEDKAPVDSSGQ